jgi:hypothetical protein
MLTKTITAERRRDDVDLSDLTDAYDRLDVAGWSDAELVAAAGSVLADPKEAPADSFVLHAPLELLARSALLTRVRPEGRDEARRRIVELAAAYRAAGEPLIPTVRAPSDSFGSVDVAFARLAEALGVGDLDLVDQSATYLADRVPPARLAARLGPALVTSLGAAAHGGILMYLLGRDPAGGVDRRIIRGGLREIGRHPDWQLTWFADPDLPAETRDQADPSHGPVDATPEDLVEALADVPLLGVPGSTFIFPIMNQAEASGSAARLLAPLLGRVLLGGARDEAGIWAVRAGLARVAALSMLQEGPEHAPYGWTHCLTMPQAVMALAGAVDPKVAVAVAATHVVGFRGALGTRAVDLGWQPAVHPLVEVAEAIDAGQEVAAATVWHAPPSALGGIVAYLASNAAGHRDAHLVKYTLACLDAASTDPRARRLYLAAAASLAAWWAVADRTGA